MKKYILLSFILTLLLPTVQAGEKDWHIGLSPTVLLNPNSRTFRYGGSISLEKQLKSRNLMEFNLWMTGDKQTKDILKDSEIILSGYYKPVMSLGKNSYSLFKWGPSMGFGQSGFLFGVSAGFEYDIVFKSRVKMFISQENSLLFRSANRVSCGLSIGFRIPL